MKRWMTDLFKQWATGALPLALEGGRVPFDTRRAVGRLGCAMKWPRAPHTTTYPSDETSMHEGGPTSATEACVRRVVSFHQNTLLGLPLITHATHGPHAAVYPTISHPLLTSVTSCVSKGGTTAIE